MLPLSDDNRGRRSQPILTWGLIVVNVLIFVYQYTLSQAEHMQFLMDWAAIPERITSGEQLHTLITSAFLHGSWMHLGGNMLFLWIFGDNVEDVLGKPKFLLFYVVTAIAAAAAQILIDPGSTVPMVGASGAISGLLAGYIVLFPNGRIRTAIVLGIFISVTMLPAWMMIGYWFLLQLISGVTSLGSDTSGGGVAFFAHVGGFVAGFIIVRFLANKGRLVNQRASRTNDPETRNYGFGQRRRG